LVTSPAIAANDKGQLNYEINMFGLVTKWQIDVIQYVSLLRLNKGI
jgi:hypothetical protein